FLRKRCCAQRASSMCRENQHRKTRRTAIVPDQTSEAAGGRSCARWLHVERCHRRIRTSPQAEPQGPSGTATPERRAVRKGGGKGIGETRVCSMPQRHLVSPRIPTSLHPTR